MRTMLRTLLGLGLVALLASPAVAQGRGFGRFGGSLTFLLTNESVQKELKLDDKQVDKAKDLAEKTQEEVRDKFQGFQDLSPEERRTKGMEIMREVNATVLKALGEFLKPEQITRLKQISYQQRGATAFLDPEVQKKLNLSDSQKSGIQALIQQAFSQMPSREEFQDDREAAMKKMREVNQKVLAESEKKLNDEQQKTWKEVLGAPFEVKYENQ
ncbi:MAG TPA: hypothetical protein VFF52_03370 [Isosphaeraceae bacterium]|nr:hypothetical protein [Isosphaeraceae bacterium]